MNRWERWSADRRVYGRPGCRASTEGAGSPPVYGGAVTEAEVEDTGVAEREGSAIVIRGGVDTTGWTEGGWD